MKVFVSGAAGFIGSALARELAAGGHEVVGLARSPQIAPPTPGVTYVRGDLGREDGLESARTALASVDAVAHLAAVRRDWGMTPEALRRVNVESGPRLLALAPRAGRFLFVSSVAVYGHPKAGAASERSPFAPSKRYGVTKVEAEVSIAGACRQQGVALTIARPGIVYGPGDTYGMFANMARLVTQRRFLLVGRAANRVNLLWIGDLARGLATALVAAKAAGEDFLFAGPEAVTLERFARTVAAAVGRPLPPVRIPEWAARAGARVLEGLWGALGLRSEPFLTKAKVDLMTCEDLWDTAKARTLLGWQAAVGLDEGAPRAVAWLRQAGELR